MSKRSHWKSAVVGCVILFVASSVSAEEPLRYYVGEKVCRGCHAACSLGASFPVWRLSAHAKAYSVLSLPESLEIAELSGVDVHPRKSPICLGCHTTAPTVEDWELDEGVHREDGVQCEACHGPGSEYIDEEIMSNPESARQAGLRMPTEKDCMVCHEIKGTHVAIVKSKKFDPAEGMKLIKHTLGSSSNTTPPEIATADLEKPHYIGSGACKRCHGSIAMGDAFSTWQMSKHAQAYALLSTKATEKHPDPANDAECRKCHVTGAGLSRENFGPLFEIEDGVQCEACHGPGSEYAHESVMLDPKAAKEAGLIVPGEEQCRACHKNDFDYEAEWEKIAHPLGERKQTASANYKTPINMALNPDGSLLLIACEESNSLIAVDTETRKKVAEIPVGMQPHDVCFSPDGRHAYVTNRMDDSLSVLDIAERKVLQTVPTGDEPHAVLTDATGETLYVANYGTADISLIDAQTLQTIKRLSAARGTWALARSPDGNRIYASNSLSHFVKFRTPPRSEITIIDTERQMVVERPILTEANLLQGIDVSPDGAFALVTLLRTKNLVPMTRISQGWTITNGLGVVWPDGTTDQILLDEVNAYFADPTDVAITPDGRYAYVTGGGIDAVAVVDLSKLRDLLAQTPERERREILPNHLGKTVEYVVKRIPVGASPRGVSVAPDGKTVYVANGLSDSIAVIDVSTQEAVGTIDLEGPREINQQRKGNLVFHSASITFQNQFSCHSCHPDGNVDGITYDIEPDGIGRNPVDNRTLRGILDTAPFKWEGTNPSLQRQCGPRLAVFFTRIDPFTQDELEALDHYICTIPRPPNRNRALGADLTEAQRRGKTSFERTTDNLGRPIPEEQRCSGCHSGPYYTNRTRVDVATQSWLDTDGIFDVPHLNNIYETAPYLHDGRADSLEEIWTRYNPNDRHGITNDMTKDQLNDLVEYLKIL